MAFSAYDNEPKHKKEQLIKEFRNALKNMEKDSVFMLIFPLNFNNSYIDILKKATEGL